MHPFPLAGANLEPRLLVAQAELRAAHARLAEAETLLEDRQAQLAAMRVRVAADVEELPQVARGTVPVALRLRPRRRQGDML